MSLTEWLMQYGGSPESVLRWVVAGGSSVAANIVLSFLLERVAAFQKQTRQTKDLTVKALSFAIGFGAWAAITYLPPETFARVTPILGGVITVVLGMSTPPAAHAVRKVLSIRQ